MLLLLFSSIWFGSAALSGAQTYNPPALAFAATTSASTSTSPSTSSSEHHSGRRWKNRRKRQTFIPSPVRTITVQEEEALLDQLGYVPPNVCAVSARSGFDDVDDNTITINNGIGDELLLNDNKHSKIDTSSKGVGRPIAIQSYPLLVQIHNKNNKSEEEKSNERSNEHYNYTPFPTMYWLTDPHVSRAISEIERNGYVRKFQSRLENDASLARDWWHCHEDYAAERWKLLSKSDRDWLLLEQLDEDDIMSVEEQRMVHSMCEMIMLSGVAGTDHRRLREKDDDNDNYGKVQRNKDTTSLHVPSVKCLHSHYAHYRSQKERCDDNTVINIIGKWTHDLLIEEFPDLIL